MLQASPFGGFKVDSPLAGRAGSPGLTPSSLAAYPSDVVLSPVLTRPTPFAKEMLASPAPLPAYTKLEAATSMVSLHLLCLGAVCSIGKQTSHLCVHAVAEVMSLLGLHDLKRAFAVVLLAA